MKVNWFWITVLIFGAFVLGWVMSSTHTTKQADSRRPSGKIGFGQTEPEQIA